MWVSILQLREISYRMPGTPRLRTHHRPHLGIEYTVAQGQGISDAGLRDHSAYALRLGIRIWGAALDALRLYLERSLFDTI